MPRTKNITPKYELKVNCGDENLHTGTYCSLKEIAFHLNFPYTTITDIFQGRRVSLNSYANCKYFPKIEITNLN